MYKDAGAIPMDRKITARIDLESVKTVKDVELGEEVEITIKGKVCCMRGVEQSMWTDEDGKEHKSTYPGSLEIEISKIKVYSSSEFDDMEDD